MYEALRYSCMKPYAASVARYMCGGKEELFMAPIVIVSVSLGVCVCGRVFYKKKKLHT